MLMTDSGTHSQNSKPNAHARLERVRTGLCKQPVHSAERIKEKILPASGECAAAHKAGTSEENEGRK